MKQLVATVGVCVGILALAGGHGPARASGAYSVVVIDVPGSSLTVASGIDVLGRIVGHFTDATGTHGFLLTNGALTIIDYPGARWTSAHGMNTAGQIVGAYGEDGSNGRRGFLLSGGQFTSLDVPGSTDTVPRSINNRGQIVVSIAPPTAYGTDSC